MKRFLESLRECYGRYHNTAYRLISEYQFLNKFQLRCILGQLDLHPCIKRLISLYSFASHNTSVCFEIQEHRSLTSVPETTELNIQ